MSASHLSRRTVMEWMLSIGALAIIAVVISRMDTRVGSYVTSAFTGNGAAVGVPDSLSRSLRAALDLCRDHQPLAVFAGVAFVLVLFMRRLQ